MADEGTSPPAAPRGASVWRILVSGLLSELFSANGVIAMRAGLFGHSLLAPGNRPAAANAALASAAWPLAAGCVLAAVCWIWARRLGGVIRWIPGATAAIFSAYCLLLFSSWRL